jgi:hypothetical protein
MGSDEYSPGLRIGHDKPGEAILRFGYFQVQYKQAMALCEEPLRGIFACARARLLRDRERAASLNLAAELSNRSPRLLVTLPHGHRGARLRCL